ncbi:GNAT family N-acetyltransferase [Actinoplanes nipponensis]|uniref:N-acetyltransferase n=1 Tax=Actinoplanes nipponensis TaxID=135950 RepID=A0A919MJ22_9ACTN|nr:N-acetyltransferase [Actinoplanes nipponensis]GIE47016.1 N-acetyltransferase [Actinoplanes nipponensis]
MMIRRERSDDGDAIHAVTAAAFRGLAYSAPPAEPGGDPGEATLVSWLRDDAGWIPELSLVAIEDDQVVGHVLATRAHVGARPVLGLGPLSVLPRRQRSGVGTALMHAVLGAADALGEPLVALLGNPSFYGRFGFVAAQPVGIAAPVAAWGDSFQVRTLSRYDGLAGRFRYARPFDRL